MSRSVTLEEDENKGVIWAPGKQEEPKEIEIPVISHYRLGTVAETPTENKDEFNTPADEVKKSFSGLTPVAKRRITNDIKKRLESVDGTAQSKQLEIEDITAYNAFEVITPPYNLNYLSKLYKMSPPHKAAVDAKVSNIVGLGWKFVESEKTKRKLEALEGQQDRIKSSRKRLMSAKEELSDKVDNLNTEDSFTETLVKVWKDYEVMGNGYLEISRKKDGTIGYIGHLPAVNVRIRRKRDGFVQMISNKVVFFANFGDGIDSETGKRKSVNNPFGSDSFPNEVIHIKNYAPGSDFYGVPDIIAATNAIVGNEFSDRFNLDYFENKAVPRHLIILKGATLATPTENALLTFLETGLKGQNHRTLYIPLPPDQGDNKVELKIEPIEAGMQDSSFEKYKKQNLSAILMAHRVPISKIGLAEGVSLAVARDADKTFKEQVCAPQQKIFEKKLSRIFKEFTDAFVLKLDEMTLTDADTQSKIDERDIKNQIRVANEIRADRGLPGRKGGDKPLDLKPQQAADARAKGTRERDAQRSAGASDSAGEARQPKGEGRATG